MWAWEIESDLIWYSPSLLLLLLWISNNPGIHEGFSELSGCYIFMIMSQWWTSGGSVVQAFQFIHSWSDLSPTSLLVFILHQSAHHPGPSSPPAPPLSRFVFLVFTESKQSLSLSVRVFINVGTWKIILSKQIRSFTSVASFPEELATSLCSLS